MYKRYILPGCIDSNVVGVIKLKNHTEDIKNLLLMYKVNINEILGTECDFLAMSELNKGNLVFEFISNQKRKITQLQIVSQSKIEEKALNKILK